MDAVSSPILLFDGECNLCDATVRFVLQHERAAEFRFAALQSAPARELLAPFGVAPDDLSTVLVLEGNRLWRESDAVVRILRRLRLPYRLLAALALLPRGLRDRGYRFVGGRRYAWWGRRESGDVCPTATPAQRERFLG
ncbi:MAG: DUF393 domain-containing protein [Lautropia sp.]